MAARNNRQVGTAYEAQAEAYLQRQGCQILDRNYRIRQGEIDLIALDGGCLVFVEVKYRSGNHAGNPAEAVTKAKQRTIYRVAEHYLYEKRYDETMPIRFDVIAILGEEITWIRDAFVREW